MTATVVNDVPFIKKKRNAVIIERADDGSSWVANHYGVEVCREPSPHGCEVRAESRGFYVAAVIGSRGVTRDCLTLLWRSMTVSIKWGGREVRRRACA